MEYSMSNNYTHIAYKEVSEQVVQLWKRESAKLDTFRLTSSVIRKIIQKLHFWTSLWGIWGNISALYKIFNAKNLCNKVSSNVSFTRKTTIWRFCATLWVPKGNVYAIHL